MVDRNGFCSTSYSDVNDVADRNGFCSTNYSDTDSGG